MTNRDKVNKMNDKDRIQAMRSARMFINCENQFIKCDELDCGTWCICQEMLDWLRSEATNK